MTASSSNATVPKYMNTYRTGPKKKFNSRLVYDILEEVVMRHCFGTKYDSSKSCHMVTTISEEILSGVKKLEFDRCRLIVSVQIVANKRQEMETAMKILWDTPRDRFVTYSLRGGSMLTTATCFGIYKD
ncbi:hypothetical protein RUM44_011298 [Polyplax serrata]|uniref:Uncharacterized protein n=1 Tax=Polyplax serrata TaxID=468196 RepID=A0ABR1AR51_POLSC